MLVSCLLLMAGSAFGWLLWRAARQERLNHALLNAVHQQASEELPALLRQGADPNARDTAQAPRSWHEILRLWLHRSSADTLTDTALMLAARKGDFLSTQRLLDAGARVNAVNSSNETALTLAFLEDHADLMQTLLARGADPNVKTYDLNYNPPLVIATLRKFNRPVYGDTTCRTLARLMLDKGADVHATDSNGDTPLLVAIEVEEPEIAQWLIARGADINKGNQTGDTPLQVSVNDAGSLSILKVLLQRGVDVTTAHNNGWNLLCWAAETGNTAIAKEALRRGLSVNSRDKRGRTPLDVCSRQWRNARSSSASGTGRKREFTRRPGLDSADVCGTERQPGSGSSLT